MRIGVLGTGIVGETIGTRLVGLDHEVRMGAREATNERARAWAEGGGGRASHGSFADAAAFGELIVNCTSGAHSLDALHSAGPAHLYGKVLIDVANPLDFSGGMPPTLGVCNTDSLGEQIQRAFPEARVVKALSTMKCAVMVRPDGLPGEHDVPICGDDAAAKAQASSLLRSFGWAEERILDLGDITAARGMEMYVALWLRLWGALGTGDFNLRVVR